MPHTAHGHLRATLRRGLRSRETALNDRGAEKHAIPSRRADRQARLRLAKNRRTYKFCALYFIHPARWVHTETAERRD